MTWYYIIMALLLLIGLVYRELTFSGGGSTAACAALCCAVLFVFAALRGSDVGADTLSYERAFSYLRGLKFSELQNINTGVFMTDGTDLTYRYYNKLVGLFFSSPHAITVINSAIIIIALYRLVMTQSKDPWLSIVLFVSLGMYQLSLNLAPFFMGILVASCGYEAITRGDFIDFASHVVLGSLLHPAVLGMLPLFFIGQIPLKTRSFVLGFAILSIITLMLFQPITSLLDTLLGGRYRGYYTREALSYDKIAVWVVHVVLFIICWFAQEEPGAMVSSNSLACWIFMLESVVYLALTQSSGLNRAAFLFSPYIIVTIPNLLSTARTRKGTLRTDWAVIARNRVLAARHLNTYKGILIIVCIAQYILRMQYNNIGTTIPYTFWEGFI